MWFVVVSIQTSIHPSIHPYIHTYIHLHVVEVVKSGATLTWVPKWMVACLGWVDNNHNNNAIASGREEGKGREVYNVA